MAALPTSHAADTRANDEAHPNEYPGERPNSPSVEVELRKRKRPYSTPPREEEWHGDDTASPTSKRLASTGEAVGGTQISETCKAARQVESDGGAGWDQDRHGQGAQPAGNRFGFSDSQVAVLRQYGGVPVGAGGGVDRHVGGARPARNRFGFSDSQVAVLRQYDVYKPVFGGIESTTADGPTTAVATTGDGASVGRGGSITNGEEGGRAGEQRGAPCDGGPVLQASEPRNSLSEGAHLVAAAVGLTSTTSTETKESSLPTTTTALIPPPKSRKVTQTSSALSPSGAVASEVASSKTENIDDLSTIAPKTAIAMHPTRPSALATAPGGLGVEGGNARRSATDGEPAAATTTRRRPSPRIAARVAVGREGGGTGIDRPTSSSSLRNRHGAKTGRTDADNRLEEFRRAKREAPSRARWVASLYGGVDEEATASNPAERLREFRRAREEAHAKARWLAGVFGSEHGLERVRDGDGDGGGGVRRRGPAFGLVVPTGRRAFC